MNKRQEKIFVLVSGIAVIIVLIFVPWSNSYFGLFIDKFREPDWDHINPPDIVKNTIVMTLINKNEKNCELSVPNLRNVIEHPYFVRGEDFAQEINFNKQNETIILPCEMIKDEKSKLDVWYVLKDAPRFSGEYRYFITPLDNSLS
jgi:hypothetical protein